MTADNKSAVTPLRPKRPCPECGRPSARDTYPFCSKRCKDVDLGRWLKGAYVIPARDDEEEAEDGPPPTPPE
ncbi:zinc-binding protein [Mesorhizobium sp. Root157]|uniref:DNA gyrase inhibitor YacG n=1 Tax=Mesorhizobium sp. Root157 TaxID=1736477 RepID=UPI0006FECEB1|nr:DNA gyrase inhibitor YacG [Mesorhizobium sp. Root157]KQZ79064.1 zinc-binding protein [Mesorhizobium sp. Root157]